MRFFRKFHFSNWPTVLYLPIAAAIGFRFLMRALNILFQPVPETSLGIPLATSTGERRQEIWIFGASSLVGRHLLPKLLAAGYRVRAFGRDPSKTGANETPHLSWHAHDLRKDPSLTTLPAAWHPDTVIHLAPLFSLAPILSPLKDRGLKAVIAFGSTSSLTKLDSSIATERQLATDLSKAEKENHLFCESARLRWVILRPTMIYSLGHDQNITRLARFIDRFRFFPLPGNGIGLRQPVHANDLATACTQILETSVAWNQIYNLSGGEILTYRAMLDTIFRRLGHTPRIISLPDWLWQLAIGLVRSVPRYRDLNMAMVRRIENDMCFSHNDATVAFGYNPRPFQP
jgi:nucleoside-diphosphate-sugar epimerase